MVSTEGFIPPEIGHLKFIRKLKYELIGNVVKIIFSNLILPCFHIKYRDFESVGK